jgi:hypothetical protein
LLGWGLLRRNRQEHARLIETVGRSRRSALRQEEVEPMSEKRGQTWEEELLALGEARARAREKALRFAEGQLLAYRKVLEMWLRQRFGELPADVVQRVGQADLPALQRAADVALTVTALEDLPL